MYCIYIFLDFFSGTVCYHSQLTRLAKLTDIGGFTPLHLACQMGHWQLLPCLVCSSAISAIGCCGWNKPKWFQESLLRNSLMRLVQDIDTYVLYESNQTVILRLVITRLVWDIKTSQALHNLNDWKLVGIPHVTRPQGETLFIRAPLSLLHLLGIVSLWWIFFGRWDEELYRQHQISYYIVLPSSHKVPPVCPQYPSLNYSPEMLHQMWSKGWGHAEAAWAFEQSVGKSPRFWWSSSGVQRAELHAILTDFVFPTSQYCVSSIISSPVNVIVLHDWPGRTQTHGVTWGMSG